MAIDPNTVGGAALGSGITAGLIALGFIALLIFIGVYIYFALAGVAVAKKMKHQRPWLAWIPFANISLWLQMGGFHWAWVFLMLIPILGWIAILVLIIIAHWRVYEILKFPGWLSLAILLDIFATGLGVIAHGVIIGIVAWSKNDSKITPIRKVPAKKSRRKK